MNTQSLDKGIRFASVSGSAVITPGNGCSVNHLPEGAVITWDVNCAIAPGGQTRINLEGCNGDPSVAANWFQLDQVDMNGITDSMRHVALKPCIWLRVNPTENPSARVIKAGIFAN